MEKMKNTFIYIVLIVIIILLLLKGCEIQKDRDNMLTQLSTFKIENQNFKVKVNKDSSTIVTQRQTILTQDEAIKLGILKLNGEIKKVQSQVNQVQEFVINDVPVPYVPDNFIDTSGWYVKLKNGDTSKSICDSFIKNSVLVGTQFKKDEKWLKMDGKIKKDGLQLDSMTIPNESSVTIGYRKYGFFNLKSEPIVEIKNTNPYLKVSKVSNVLIKNNKSIFSKKGFWFAIGILGGVYLHTKL
jgi:hypothetical protein